MDSPTIPRVVVEGGETRHHGGGSGGSERTKHGGRNSRRMTTMMVPSANRELKLAASPVKEVISSYRKREGLRGELEKPIGGMWEHLEWAGEVVAGLEVNKREG